VGVICLVVLFVAPWKLGVPYAFINFSCIQVLVTIIDVP
jgi:hypothetical protein